MLKPTFTILVTFLLLTLSTNAFAKNEKLVGQYMKAFNRHDIEGMLRYLDTDVKWMSISDDVISAEAKGHNSIRAAMKNYFATTKNTRSRLQDMTEHGDFVTVTEQAHWEVDGKMASQCSLSVYQISAKKIKNVWYFSAYPCD